MYIQITFWFWKHICASTNLFWATKMTSLKTHGMCNEETVSVSWRLHATLSCPFTSSPTSAVLASTLSSVLVTVASSVLAKPASSALATMASSVPAETFAGQFSTADWGWNEKENANCYQIIDKNPFQYFQMKRCDFISWWNDMELIETQKSNRNLWVYLRISCSKACHSTVIRRNTSSGTMRGTARNSIDRGSSSGTSIGRWSVIIVFILDWQSINGVDVSTIWIWCNGSRRLNWRDKQIENRKRIYHSVCFLLVGDVTDCPAAIAADYF